ncbi:MAG: cobalamin biosynthesis protein CobD [Rhodospirillales bacterium]|nr:cobalamin biosynthesis protein CobD [Rhodospirillales bacterium]
MLTDALIGGHEGIDPLFLVLIALFIEAYVGEARAFFRVVPHPVRIIGGAVAALDRKLNREQRSDLDRAVRGGLTVLIVVVPCALIGIGVAWLTQHHGFGWIVELLLLVSLLAQRNLYDHVRAVGKALREGGLPAGRGAVAHLVGRDVETLDEHGVARAAIESAAENFSDGVVAPVFWYTVFGFPGLLVYKAVNTMDSMIGLVSPKYRAFGKAAARLDDLLNLIPARLSGLLFALAAVFTPTASPWRALKTMFRDAGRHRSPNAGWPESAVAGALGLALAGPRHYPGHHVKDAWMGDGRTRATGQDISRTLYLYTVAGFLNALWLASLALFHLAW